MLIVILNCSLLSNISKDVCIFPIDSCKKRAGHTIFVIILVSLSIIGIILIAVAVNEYMFCGNARHEVSAVGTYTRSGSVSLLAKTHTYDLTCFEPTINAQLKGEASVTIYEVFCGDLRTKEFSIGRKSLPYDNVIRPIVVLSEDFGENYFLKGTVDIVVNATFNASLSGTAVYVCLFVDYEVFMDFTNSDKDWRKYMKNATCRHTSEEHFKTTFNVANPNYVFIALATTNALDTLQFGFNGTRYGYDIPTFTNMTALCTLRSDKPGSSMCTFSVSDTDDLCLLASNSVNADSSYDYSTIILSFPHIKNHTVVGVSLTVLALFFLVVPVAIVLFVICGLSLRKSRSQS